MRLWKPDASCDSNSADWRSRGSELDTDHNAVSADTGSRLVNLQGVKMGRPSRIYIKLSSRGGVLEGVWVGAEVVVVGDGTITD